MISHISDKLLTDKNVTMWVVIHYILFLHSHTVQWGIIRDITCVALFGLSS